MTIRPAVFFNQHIILLTVHRLSTYRGLAIAASDHELFFIQRLAWYHADEHYYQQLFANFFVNLCTQHGFCSVPQVKSGCTGVGKSSFHHIFFSVQNFMVTWLWWTLWSRAHRNFFCWPLHLTWTLIYLSGNLGCPGIISLSLLHIFFCLFSFQGGNTLI